MPKPPALLVSCTKESDADDSGHHPVVQALILVGGEGTRLRPLTTTVPKPVLPLANRPFITYMIEWLATHGFEEVVLSCMFLSAGIKRVLGEDEWDGTRLHYVEEPEPRGTAGAVKFAEAVLGKRFAVLNGDILTDFDLSALLRAHEETDARATLALIEVDDPSAYGLVLTDADGRVTDFVEKPDRSPPGGAFINAGAYVLEREVLDPLPDDRAVSFEREVFPSLVGDGLYAYKAKGAWFDIGTPERYLEATSYLLERSGEDVLMGSGCEIAPGARIGPTAVLGDRCRVEEALVERAVLFDGATVERGAVVRDSIVGRGARIGAGSRLEHETVVADEALVEAGSVLSGAKVERRRG
jgi:mannose-1-phosphate guanylyltransferase